MTSGPEAAIGIDIGSRTTKIVRLSGEILTHDYVFDTGYDPFERVLGTLDEISDAADTIIATGYGRRMAQSRLTCKVVTEIRACAAGAMSTGYDSGSVIDIGGQDTKVIELTGDGGFGRFEMNDRCAAGTGRFFEVMARALNYSLEEFGLEAFAATSPVHMSSMCTVFAESEVVALLAKGEDRRRIALGLHLAAAKRVAASASRITLGRRILFVGGVANNPCMRQMLEDELPVPPVVPERPELIVARGAAFIGLAETGKTHSDSENESMRR